MKTKSKLAAIGASLALATAGFFGASTAGAESIDVSTPLTEGSGLTLTIGGNATELPAPDGSNFTGTYDDATGDLNGTVTIEAGSFPITDPLPLDVFFHFESGGPITDGTIDTETHAVSFTDTQTLYLDRAGDILNFGDDCAFGPITLHYTGTYDAETNQVNVSTPEIAVPAVTGTCGGQAGLIGGLLEGATVQANLGFALEVGEIPTTTTTTTTVAPTTVAPTTVPAKPATAQPATAVAAKPAYTG